MANLPDLTLVIDIGKSHAKLLWVDDHGMVVDRRSRDNRSVQSPLGYPALDIAGLTDWMQQVFDQLIRHASLQARDDLHTRRGLCGAE